MSTSRQNKVSEGIRKTRAYYNENALLWTARKTNSFHHEKEFALFASYVKRGRVIDIGCAGGILVPLFLGIGRHLRYVGIDISESFLKIARRRYPQLVFKKGNIADAKTLPRTGFDGFLAIAVLMHLPRDKWDVAFRNIESMLKPGAFGYLTLPVAHPSGTEAPHDPRQFTILTEKEQTAYLKNRGWKIIKKVKKDGFATEGVWRGYLVQVP